MTRRETIVIPIQANGFREPTLEDILSDAITQAVMQADAVDVGRLEAMLRDVAGVRRHAERDFPEGTSRPRRSPWLFRLHRADQFRL